jgi:hypothetical protein
VEVDRQFSVQQIRIPLSRDASSTATVTPTISVDGLDFSQELTAINSTNFSGNSAIVYKRPEISMLGKQNLKLKLAWTGTGTISVIGPIEIDVDFFDTMKTT